MKSFFETIWFRVTLGTLIITFLIIFSGQAQTYDTIGYFHINSISQSGKSLAFVKKDSSITLKPTVPDAPSQLWKWETVKIEGVSGRYRIVNKQLGNELYLSADKVGDDFIVTFFPKKEATGQLWNIENFEGNSRIITMWSNKCLQVTNSVGLECREKTDSPAFIEDQLWKLKSQKAETPAVGKPVQAAPVAAVINPPVNNGAQVSPAKSGLDTAAIYRIITNEMPDKSLGIEIDGTIEQAVLEPAINHPLQEWKLALNANGFYQLINQYYKSKSLEVTNSDGRIIINATKDSKEQLWKIVLTHEGAYQISSVWLGSGRSLDFVEDGEEKNAMRLSDVNSTIWTFIKLRTTAPAPKPEVKPVVISNNKNKLIAGEQLKENAKLISANGEYSLVQQADGNLVIYNTKNKAIWASGMDGKNVKRCVMQKDGNLVQHPGGYDLSMWSTETRGNAGAYAMLQDDGALVIINSENQVIWSSKN